MVKRKIKDKKRYVLSFIIGTFVFLLVLGISYSVALFQYTRVSDLQSVTAYSLFEQKSFFTFFGDDICLEENFEDVSRSLDNQGKIMDDLESKFGKSNQQVLERKKFYSVLLLEHLGYVNSYNQECEPKRNVILFFYSNMEDEDYSGKAGRTLDNVRSQRERVLVYSFDINLESSIVERLKEEYNITFAPSIVINEQTTLIWPFSFSDIEEKLI